MKCFIFIGKYSPKIMLLSMVLNAFKVYYKLFLYKPYLLFGHYEFPFYIIYRLLWFPSFIAYLLYYPLFVFWAIHAIHMFIIKKEKDWRGFLLVLMSMTLFWKIYIITFPFVFNF